MRAVVFGSNSRNACVEYASLVSATIERGCSIGANHAQNSQLTSSTTHAAFARFRIIRAGFNKHSAPAFPKADHRCDIRSAPFLNLNVDEVCGVCLEVAALPDGEISMDTIEPEPTQTDVTDQHA